MKKNMERMNGIFSGSRQGKLITNLNSFLLSCLAVHFKSRKERERNKIMRKLIYFRPTMGEFKNGKSY